MFAEHGDFEKWILQKNGGSLNQEAIEQVNAAILNATYNEHNRKVVLHVSGLEDDGSITNAVTLSNLADWEEFHRNLVSGYEESPQETIITGGCHCGAVRYRVTNPAYSWSGVCHCYSCRLVGGAPYLPWVSFPKESFEWIRGEPKHYYYIRWWEDSAIAWTERGFCDKCGTQLTHMNNDEPPEERKHVAVNIISLDHPNAFPPKGWTGGIGSRLEWVPLPDEAVPELISVLRNRDASRCNHQSALGSLKQIGTPEAMKAVEAYEKQSQATQSEGR